MATIYPNYSDFKNGTYVHTIDEKNYVSPVTNPNGNENLDESHRNIDDTDFRPEFRHRRPDIHGFHPVDRQTQLTTVLHDRRV